MNPTRAVQATHQDSERILTYLARSRLFRVLSLAIAPPETAILDRVVNASMLDDIRRVAELLKPEVRKAVYEFMEALERVQTDHKLIRRDYESSFNESTGGHFPLYETEYTSPHVFAKTQAMADVAGFYHAFGMRSSRRLGDRPDRASTELEFLHLLTLLEADASSKGDKEKIEICSDAERKFIEDHVGRWLLGLGRIISETANTKLYRSLGRLLMVFLGDEIFRVGAKPEEAKIQSQQGLDPKDDIQCGLGAVGRP